MMMYSQINFEENILFELIFEDRGVLWRELAAVKQ